MERVYATFVVGDKEVVVYDEKLSRINTKSVIVTQPASELYDKEKKKHVLDLGRMLVKVDGKPHECIEFRKFKSQEDRDKWIDERRQLLAPTPDKS